MCHPKETQDFERAKRNGRAERLISPSRNPRYGIQMLEQVFVPSYSKGVRSAMANTFEMTIIEPNSVTLLEEIVTMARRLGIENHTQAAYFVKISFIGRTPDGAVNKPPPEFLFAVIFRAFEISVTDSGAEYRISAVETGAAGYNYLENTIKSGFTFEAADFGEFISELEKQLNESLILMLETNPDALYPYEYEITVDDSATEWKKWKFQQIAAEGKIGISNVDGDKLQFVASPGTSISDFVGIGLLCTEEYKQIATSDGVKVRPDGSGEFSKDAITKVKLFYSIVSDVTATDWDPMRNDYAKKIQYKVMAYKKPSTFIDVAEQADISDPTKQKKRAQKLFDEGLLRKRYDYLFTGLNTSVMNLDVKFDFAYYTVSPIGGGKIGDANTARSIGNDETNATHADRLSKSKTEFVSAKRSLSVAKSKYAVVSSQIEKAATSSQPVTSNLIRQAESLERQISAAESLVRVKTDELKASYDRFNRSNGNSEFTQDLDRNDGIAPVSGVDAPLRSVNDVVSTSDTYAPENDRDGGSIMFGAVKTNLETPSDMITIDIDIKGDPFWLGRPNTFRTAVDSSTAYDSMADFETGENMFYLNINFPSESLGNTGRRTPRPEYSISGVYSVINIINRFSEGVFTQNMRAVRDVLSNVSSSPTEYNKP